MANFELDFDLDFDLDLSSGFDGEAPLEPDFDIRYFAPPAPTHIPERFLCYEHAEQLAKDIELFPGCRYYVLLNGTFYFGDFIEALIFEKKMKTKKLTVSTLSLNQDNVDSFANLMNGGAVDKFDLIVSDFFFSHERRKEGLIPYVYDELDKPELWDFQLSACRSHTKTATFETALGNHLVIHGSANLRTSDNLELICIEESKPVYEWFDGIFSAIVEKYKTIDKKTERSLRGKNLWQVAAAEKAPKKA